MTDIVYIAVIENGVKMPFDHVTMPCSCTGDRILFFADPPLLGVAYC